MNVYTQRLEFRQQAIQHIRPIDNLGKCFYTIYATTTHDHPAFSSIPQEASIPRADDLENLMFLFPGIKILDYDNPPPPCIYNELDVNLWNKYHATQCRATPSCTETTISDNCYFKPFHYDS